MRVKVFCVGNDYQLDDGFGPAVARALRASGQLPAGVEVIDCGVMGYALVGDLMACDAAVTVDALDGTGAAPGTLLSFSPDDLAQSSGVASLHDVRFADVWASARFMGSPCTHAQGFGVQVQTLGDGTLQQGLSEPVAAAVEPCAQAVLAYLRELLDASKG
nr:hydrogenase maturation protease [Collinsella tanakaei]